VTADDIVAARSLTSTRYVSRRVLAHTPAPRAPLGLARTTPRVKIANTSRTSSETPGKQTRGRQLLYTARTVPVRTSSSSTRSEARVVTRVFRVLNQIRPSSPCLMSLRTHFLSRDWSILRFYPPSDRGSESRPSRVVAARRATERTSARGSSVRVRAWDTSRVCFVARTRGRGVEKRRDGDGRRRRRCAPQALSWTRARLRIVVVIITFNAILTRRRVHRRRVEVDDDG
jgi:hypothetical protein